MKTLLLSALSMTFATSVMAGMTVPVIDATPSASSSNGADGALILLLMVGAVLLVNGLNQGSDRAKTPEADAQDDDDLIMRF